MRNNWLLDVRLNEREVCKTATYGNHMILLDKKRGGGDDRRSYV